MLANYISLYLQSLVNLTMEMAPFLLLGFVIAGILHVYVPAGMFTKWLGQRNIKSVVYAALMGIPLPLCSCGVIPTGISLYRDGASKGATVSFLISTPQTGVDSIMVTYSMLGMPFAIARPIIALLTGLFGGLLVNRFSEPKENKIAEESTIEDHQHSRSVTEVIRYAFSEFLGEIADWLLIGLFLAALIDVAVPTSFFESSILNNGFVSMFIVLVASIPLYVCATGSVPIAAVLLMKGLNPGAVLVFLMAGPATNVATMAVISKTLGKRTLFLYLFSLVAGSIFFGALINGFFPENFFVPSQMEMDHHGSNWMTWLEYICAGLLGFFILRILLLKIWHKVQQNRGTQKISEQSLTVKVDGMTCQNCRFRVEEAILKIPGVNTSKVDLESGMAEIQGNNITLDDIRKTVEKTGYRIHEV